MEGRKHDGWMDGWMDKKIRPSKGGVHAEKGTRKGVGVEGEVSGHAQRFQKVRHAFRTR